MTEIAAVLALASLAFAAALIHARIWPLRVCRHCNGAKETGPSNSRTRRPCWWCGGTGRTRRWLAPR